MNMLDSLYSIASIDFGTFESRKESSITFREALVTMVVDGSEQRCSVPVERSNSEMFYSGKKCTHTVTKLVVASPLNGRIIWMSNSYQGSKSDMGYDSKSIKSILD